MIDIISVDKNVLILNELTISEFVYLSEMHKQGSINVVDWNVIGKIDFERLEEKGFLKRLPTGPVLREKARELFVDEKNNFYRFLSTFPIKTPKGRYLSPAGTEGVAVTKLKVKWEKIFKGNRSREDKAILVLEAEIANKKKNGDLEYMKACEAWLNDACYEKYEYLLDDKSNEQQSFNHELM